MLKQSVFHNLISAQPNIRFEKSDAQSGFTWGKSASTSNILKTLGVVFEDGTIDEREMNRLNISDDDIVSELWIASDDREYPSIIDAPDGRQIPLYEALLENGREILGDKHMDIYGPHMGVLMKLIDTNAQSRRGSLSVQVHAGKDHPTRPAKPEMWKGHGKIYIGWNRDMTPEMIHDHMNRGCLEDCLNAVDIDETFLINVPGGTVHAIRYGTFLSEWSKTNVKNDPVKGSVKQATVRLYDRTDGKTPRKGKEDVEAALEVLQHSGQMSKFPVDKNKDIARLENLSEDQFYHLFVTDDVVVDEARVRTRMTASVRRQGYPVFVENGAVDVYCAGQKIDYLERGEYRIIPHILQEIELRCVSMKPAVIQRWYPPL